jgi:periplasmic divalent cation tolerance protein
MAIHLNQTTMVKDPKLYFVQTTFTDEESAVAFARSVLSARLAACVQISSPVKSLYHWNGVLETSREVVVVMKTLPATLQSLVDFVSTHHPYELPELVWFPAQASEPYASWANTHAAR